MKKIDSMYFPYVSAILKNHILMEFNQKMLTSGRSSFDPDELAVYYTEPSDDCFPIVVILGGVEGSGKSSFVSCCKKHMPNIKEESTIDCCKKLVNYMVEMESVKQSGTLYESVRMKNENYRTLLNKLKTLWCEIDDGPNSIMCDVIESTIDRQITPIIFINVREPDQIAHLKRRIEDECNVTVLTLAVLRNDPEDSMNEADKHTLEFAYDLWIKNSMTLAELEFAAVQFCLSVDHSNQVVRQLYEEILGGV